MRVACFFIGLFNTMVDYMEKGICDSVEKWRNNFLHSGVDTAMKRRKSFWNDVITAALYELRPGSPNRGLIELWLYQEQENNGKPYITNEIINTTLQDILREPITQFLNFDKTNQCLNASTKLFKGGGAATPRNEVVPFLFIVDEAAWLFESRYMHSFMWVLDQPIMSILNGLGDKGCNFFVLMLGTHSQISNFAPDYTYPSERIFIGEQYIPRVFLSLSWDTGLGNLSIDRKSKFGASSHIENLVRWGRSLWFAVYEGQRSARVRALGREQQEKTDLRRCVQFAERKLLPAKGDSDNEERNLATVAILAIRLHLNLDFVYPSRASKLVSNKMRWLVDVDPSRKHIVTTYGSEPLLVEAAALAMNSHDLYNMPGPNTGPVGAFLNALEEQLNQGFIDRGENGELTARLLRTNSVIRIVLTLSSLGKRSSNAGSMVD